MTLFTQLLAIGAAIIGFFLFVDAISYILANSSGRGTSRAVRRLSDEVFVSANGDAANELLARDDDEPKAVSSVGRHLERLAKQADIALPPHRIYIFVALLFGAFFLVFSLILGFLPAGVLIVVALVTAVFVPLTYLQSKANQRVKKFQEQFPDAIDMIVRSLRIGHPLSTALGTIAKEIPDPLGGEFAIAARQVAYGKSTPEAINEITQRIDLNDVKFFAVAVQIHHEAGGNLSEILAGLSEIIRGRFHLFRKVHALTAEGRFSAWFLSIFPVFMIFVMSAMQPGYYQEASDFAYFPHAVFVTFLLLLINVVAMKMITKLEV